MRAMNKQKINSLEITSKTTRKGISISHIEMFPSKMTGIRWEIKNIWYHLFNKTKRPYYFRYAFLNIFYIIIGRTIHESFYQQIKDSTPTVEIFNNKFINHDKEGGIHLISSVKDKDIEIFSFEPEEGVDYVGMIAPYKYKKHY